MKRFYARLKKNKKELVYYPLAVYWAILFVLTSLPSPTFMKKIKVSDKVEHLVAYFVLGVLLTLAMHFQEKYRQFAEKFYLWSVIFISLYAMLDEIHQIFIPNRSADVLDWLADFVGAVLSASLVKWFVEKYSK